MYKLTLRVDDQLRPYLHDIFHYTHLDRNEILQVAMYYGSQTVEFRNFLEKNAHNPIPSSLLEGLDTWILPKKTLERIGERECLHADISRYTKTGEDDENNGNGGSGNSGLDRFENGDTREGNNLPSKQTNTRGTISDGVIHGKDDVRQERKISRFNGEICQSDNGGAGTSRIPNTNGKTGTIKISF